MSLTKTQMVSKVGSSLGWYYVPEYLKGCKLSKIQILLRCFFLIFVWCGFVWAVIHCTVPYWVLGLLLECGLNGSGRENHIFFKFLDARKGKT